MKEQLNTLLFLETTFISTETKSLLDSWKKGERNEKDKVEINKKCNKHRDHGNNIKRQTQCDKEKTILN